MVINTMDIPIIGQKAKETKIILPEKQEPVQLNEHGTEKFARKPNEIEVPEPILGQMSVQIPPIYYWEDVDEKGVSYMMTMAFRMFGMNFGQSYPLEDTNVVKIDILRKKLFNVVKESLDVLVHHGKKVLDDSGNIHPRLVNEQEAIRFKFDPYWEKKVAAFNKLVRIAPITKKQAVKLKLLEENRLI